NSITTYDAFNRVLTVQDRNLNTITYKYTDSTRTMTMTTAEGVVVATVKNREGQTVSLTDGAGTVTSYAYDLDGNLHQTTVDTATGGLGLITVKNYDDADLLSNTVDANNVTTSYSYDVARRVLTRTVDPTGLALITSYGYDAFGEAAQVTDPNGVTTTTVFDNEGRSAAVIVDSVSTGLRLATTYSYDALGDTLTKVEGQQGTYNSTTKLWSFALAPNTDSTVTSNYTYDAAGRLIKEVVDPTTLKITTQFFYDKDGNLTRKVDANTKTWRYAYDADNRLVYAFDPLGGVTQTNYDNEGRKVHTIQYAQAYGSLGSITDTTTSSALDTSVAALKNTAADRHNRWVYDRDGRVAFTVDAVGDVTGFQYDGDGRVVQTTKYANALDGDQVTNASGYGGSASGWSVGTYGGTGVTAVSAAQAGFPTGSTALMTDSRDVYNSQFAATPGQSFNVSMDAIRGAPYVNNGQSTYSLAAIGVQFLDGSGNSLGWWYGNATADPTVAGVQHLSGIVTAPAGTVTGRVWVQIAKG